MRAICLHDKRSIERVLRQDVYLHLYSIGDLDDFFWPYTTWYTTRDEIERRPAAVARLALRSDCGRRAKAGGRSRAAYHDCP